MPATIESSPSGPVGTSAYKKFFDVRDSGFGELYLYVEMPQPKIADAQAARAAALAALDADKRKALAAFAKRCSSGLAEEGQDLLQSAYRRWLASEETIGDADQTFKYLMSALNSLRANAHRKNRATINALGQRAEPHPNASDPVSALASEQQSAEDAAFAHQVYALFAGDEEVQMMLLYQSERTSRADVQKERGWDDHKYAAIQKRKIRAIAKLKDVM